MYDHSLLSQISNRIQGFPVAVVVYPVQHWKEEVQFNIEFIYQRSYFWVLHEAEQQAPLHCTPVCKPVLQQNNKRNKMCKLSSVKSKIATERITLIYK